MLDTSPRCSSSWAQIANAYNRYRMMNCGTSMLLSIFLALTLSIAATSAIGYFFGTRAAAAKKKKA
jgi:hypothetical protein